MILVIGETYDSLLGLRSLLGESDGIEPFINDLPGYIGKIGDEDIVGVTGGTSNYLSSITATKAIARYKPRVVFSFGESSSLSPYLKLGDIVIGNRLFFHGVNFAATGLPYGAIPGFQPHFFSDINWARNAEEIAYRIGGLRAMRGDILSGEKKIVDQEEFTEVVRRRYASSGHLLCYDCTSAGIALSCNIEKVPYLPLKAITYVPLEGEEGVFRERRVALTGNETAAKLLIALLRKGGE